MVHIRDNLGKISYLEYYTREKTILNQYVFLMVLMSRCLRNYTVCLHEYRVSIF